jgi:hypothetical protein
LYRVNLNFFKINKFKKIFKVFINLNFYQILNHHSKPSNQIILVTKLLEAARLFYADQGLETKVEQPFG